MLVAKGNNNLQCVLPSLLRRRPCIYCRAKSIDNKEAHACCPPIVHPAPREKFLRHLGKIHCEIENNRVPARMNVNVQCMGQIIIKTPNPKCRLYWCLIEFIDWIYSQSCWSSELARRPSNLLTGSPAPLSPSLCE
jgi:hypothetical protein